MRYLILSDIHGNWEALESVLRRVRDKDFDATLLLGDLVGYGASPERVLDHLPALPGRRLVVVRGNHDKLVAGIEDGSHFNDTALAAANWTRERLSAQHLSGLVGLPRGPRLVEPQSTDSGGEHQPVVTGSSQPLLAICHGSPADEDAYVFSEREAWRGFCAPPEAAVTFFGHTHLPSIFVLEADRVQGLLLRGQRGRIQLDAKARYLINPGSIGQPRDRNPRASFMVYDSSRRILGWRRVTYAIARTQERIRSAGLPEALAERLELGI